MAIYLDANVLYPWRTFAESERLALSIVAAQLGQAVRVPWVAAEESAAHHRRSLEAAVATIKVAEEALGRAFNQDFELGPEPWPDVEGDVARWRGALEELATILPLSDGDAQEALRREIYGEAPARRTNKSGIGARDAAIWLTVAADHARRDEPGHLITANIKDFARDGALRRELIAELPDGVQPLQLHNGISAFLELLGKPQPLAEVTIEELQSRAAGAVVRGLTNAPSVVQAIVYEVSLDFAYRAAIKSAEPVDILRVTRYERAGEDEAVTIVDAKWRLDVELSFQRADTETPRSWWVFDELEVEGSVQVYLPEQGGTKHDAELISAQLTSDTSVGAPDEKGAVMIVTSLRD